MYINKDSLLNLAQLVTGNSPVVNLKQLLEADQSKMTQAQQVKDVKKRLSAQTIGIEIEMYSALRIEECEAYIHHHPDKFKSLKNLIDTTYDGSLDESGGNELPDDSEQLFEHLISSGTSDEAMVEAYIENGYDYGVCERNYNNAVYRLNLVCKELSNLTLSQSDTVIVDSAIEYIDESARSEIYLNEYIFDNSVFDSAIESAITTLKHLKFPELEEVLDTLLSIMTNADIREEYDEHKAYAGYSASEGFYDEAHLYLAKNDLYNYTDALREWAGDDDDESDGFGYGVEMVTNKPIPLRVVDPIIKDLVSVCNDDTVKAQFVNTGDGNTGLHLHYGISPDINHNFLDIIRLVVNSHIEQFEIFDAAGRASTEYSLGLKDLIGSLDNAIYKLDKAFNAKGKITTEIFSDFYTDRYYGVNLTNLRNTPGNKNTIEFRWASAHICQEYDDFKRYVDLMTKLVSESFTGATEMRYKGVTLSATAEQGEGHYIAKIHEDGALILVKTDTGDSRSASGQIDILSKGEYTFNGRMGDTIQRITPAQYAKYKGNKDVVVLEDPRERLNTTGKSPTINVIKGGKLIGKLSSSGIHIAGESVKSLKISEEMRELRKVKKGYGEDSDAYRTKFKELKDKFGPSALRTYVAKKV